MGGAKEVAVGLHLYMDIKFQLIIFKRLYKLLATAGKRCILKVCLSGISSPPLATPVTTVALYIQVLVSAAESLHSTAREIYRRSRVDPAVGACSRIDHRWEFGTPTGWVIDCLVPGGGNLNNKVSMLCQLGDIILYHNSSTATNERALLSCCGASSDGGR